MPRPEVLSISTDHVPSGSIAETAARVQFGDGREGVVEMFTDDRGDVVDFGGLPEHLADQDNMRIVISEHIGKLCISRMSGKVYTWVVPADVETKILFEFAIGARQHLWDGTEVEYSSDIYDPTSIHYAVSNFTRR